MEAVKARGQMQCALELLSPKSSVTMGKRLSPLGNLIRKALCTGLVRGKKHWPLLLFLLLDFHSLMSAPSWRAGLAFSGQYPVGKQAGFSQLGTWLFPW